MAVTACTMQHPFGTGVAEPPLRTPDSLCVHGGSGSPRAYHQPVMVEESLLWLEVSAGRTYVDGTAGEGGHARAMLEASRPDGVVLGIDRDPRSVEAARLRLANFGDRARIMHGNYAQMGAIAASVGITSVDGVLLDLGFSSRQIDESGYGFSFQRDEPLDMRYDDEGETAADLVNMTEERALADIIYQFGEERRSRAVARAIVNSRPIRSTAQLADVVARVVRGRNTGIHPATRTFQALRIAVNHELEHLEAGLVAALSLLNTGGRLVVIAYHSLEDRLVKRWMDHQDADCVCPSDFPVCVCEHQPTIRYVRRRVVRPTEQEVRDNPRSRSARLRAVERI